MVMVRAGLLPVVSVSSISVWRVWRTDAAPRSHHADSILWQLHWLPCVNEWPSKSPSWSSSVWLARHRCICQLTSDVSTRRLRSTDTAMCVIRRSNNSFVDRCFAAAGPRLWNTLPVHLRQCDSFGQFKRLLKTHLFGVWDRGALWRLS